MIVLCFVCLRSEPILKWTICQFAKAKRMSKATERKIARLIRRRGSVKVGRHALTGRFVAVGASVEKIVAEVVQAASTDAPRSGHVPRDLLRRIKSWVGGDDEALSWYRSYPIAELGNVTPRALVETGRADALYRYLDHIAEGGYA